jgi:hypothetical protein
MSGDPGLFPTKLIGRVARELFEHRGEMRLRLKSDAKSDVDQRVRRFGQHLLSTGDAFAQNKVVRPHAGGCPELLGKVHATQAGRGRHVRQRDALADIRLDIRQDPHQPPFWQSAPAACSARISGHQRLGKVCQDRKAHGVFRAGE